MLSPGEYSDTLRALGRFIEILGGIEIKIVDTPDHLELSWLGRSGARDERKWGPQELAALRTTIRQFRGLEGGAPQFTAAELLRTVGRELDTQQAGAVTISETHEGFLVSAQVGAERFGQVHTYSDLVSRSINYRAPQPDQETVEGL